MMFAPKVESDRCFAFSLNICTPLDTDELSPSPKVVDDDTVDGASSDGRAVLRRNCTWIIKDGRITSSDSTEYRHNRHYL